MVNPRGLAGNAELQLKVNSYPLYLLHVPEFTQDVISFFSFRIYCFFFEDETMSRLNTASAENQETFAALVHITDHAQKKGVSRHVYRSDQRSY